MHIQQVKFTMHLTFSIPVSVSYWKIFQKNVKKKKKLKKAMKLFHIIKLWKKKDFYEKKKTKQNHE